MAADQLGQLMYATAPVMSAPNFVEATGFLVQAKNGLFFVSSKHVFVSWPDDTQTLTDNDWVNWENLKFTEQASGFFIVFHRTGLKNEPQRDFPIIFSLQRFEAFSLNDRTSDVIVFALGTALDDAGVFYTAISTEDFYRPAIDIPCFTRTVLIGYPSNVWDDYNCLPIPRTGILALDARLFWRSDFLGVFSAPTYGGDSGSPVIAVFTKDAVESMYLLGVHGDGSRAFVEADLAVGFYTMISLVADIISRID